MAQKSQNANISDGAAGNATPSTRDTTDAATSSKVAGGMHSSGTASTVLPRMSDPNPPMDYRSATSQPMSKSSSAGSNPPAKNGTDTASPYGTRSRNRGQSRPNYAEDKDIDMDLYDVYPEKRDADSKKASRQSNASAELQDAPRAVNGSSRKPLPSDARRSLPQNGTKEHHPSPAASVTAGGNSASSGAASKKRKAPTSSAASQQQSSSSSPAHVSGLQASLRRSNAASSQPHQGYPETNMLSFENHKSRPDKQGRMIADDGTILARDDTVYLVCEPPGEPYYLGRIMEFIHAKNDSNGPVDSLRINWFYRPKDIGRKVQDTRAVFATMHSDTCPLTSLRGKCSIKHKSEINNLEEYRKTPDCFWYEKFYDRYIQKHYEIIPTAQIVNVPERVKTVLDERWRFILVEQGRSKELTSAAKKCKRCSGYCASNDSVDCAVCKNTYHMNCVRPPLLKKPSRGFAWSCAACSRAQEKKLEARHTPSLLGSNADLEEDEYFEDDDDEAAAVDTGRTSPADGEDAHQPATPEQIYHASLWPWRYLGIHCKPEDALDYDDRIYPRASSRLGPRHQATVLPWPGRRVEYVKPLEIKKNGRKDGKLSKEAQAALEADKIARETRPKWVQDEPAGFVPRGEDLDNDDPNNTAQLLYKPVEDVNPDVSNEEIDNYMADVRKLPSTLGLPERSTNLQDVARDLLFKNDFDVEKSLKQILKVDKAEFKEPEMTQAELKKFEEGVAKYGSELHLVMKHIKTVKPATVVRYYYTWKKTETGKRIWGNYSGRKGKKEAKKAEALANKLQDDVADDHDDSAFDADKAVDRKRGFVCKFCSTKNSRQWRRAPNASGGVVSENGGKGNKDKNTQYIVALCRRCAELWRRYAIQWEDIDEVAKKVAQGGGRAWKKKVDEELLKELQAANDMINKTVYSSPDPATTATSQEPPRKKLKGAPDVEVERTSSDTGSMSAVGTHSKKKEKVVEKPAPPPVPEIPKPRMLPCAICQKLDPLGDQHLSCRECRLTVHRNCYGIVDNRSQGKWTCDMCTNDKSPQVSIHYQCVLCPVKNREYDFVEPPKVSHKKRTEKDRERERIERENAQKAADFYRKRQEELNRPVKPREPLKRTADNNWVHVTCAVWTPEVKFGKAKAMEPSEGIPSIPRSRYAEVCAVCNQQGGACVACHQCRTPVHVECAHLGGYELGFDITPVKGSRRDQFNIVTIDGESGTMVAAVWCKDHIPQKTRVHEMHEIVDETGLNALQLYVQNFKQADLTLTGCARKANLITLAAKMNTVSPTSVHPIIRRTSLVNGTGITSPTLTDGNDGDESSHASRPGGKVCLTCGIDVSPKWYPIDKVQEHDIMNGYDGSLGAEAQKFVAQRIFQCHKCKKLNRKLKARPPPREPSPTPEPVRAPDPVEPALASPPAILADPKSSSRAVYSWAQSVHASVPVPQPLEPTQPTPPMSASVPAVQGPPPNTSPLAPSIAPRAAAPPPLHTYPPAGVPGNDWHRSALHPPNHQPINGGPPSVPVNNIQPLAPPNHLRPPPIGAMGHHPAPPPVPPMQNGHLSQPMLNGMPPSPRRLSGPPPPPIQGGGPYMHSYLHSPPHQPPQHLANGGPPIRPPEHSFAQGMMPQRSPFSTPHGSPPTSRDGPAMNREQSLSGGAPRPSENRPSNGASNSASLRNLLS